MTSEIKTTLASKILFFLLCATIIFTALAYGAVHQPIIIIFYSVAAIIVVLWAIDAFASGVLRLSKSLLQIPFIAAILYAVVQIIPFGTLAETAGITGIPRAISLEPFWTKTFALHLSAILIFFSAMLVYIDSARRLRKIVRLITIFGFVLAFFAILQGVLSPNKIYGIYESRYGSPFGSFVNRHNFAAYIEMTISVPLGLLFAGAVQKDKRLLFLTAVSLMGIALLLSGSRGGLVALLAEIFFLVIFATKSKSYGQVVLKIGLTVLMAAVIVAGAILIGGESSLTRIAETAASNDFTTNRTHIWSVTLDIIKNNLPFGAGFGAFAVAYTPFDTFNGAERVEQAHNDYLQVLADAGVVGLIIGAFFLFWLFRTGFQNSKTSNKFQRGVAIGALAGCFAVLVHSLFDFVLHTTAIALLFVTLLALIAASGNRYSDEIGDNNRDERSKKRRKSASVTSLSKRLKPRKADVEEKNQG